MARSSARPSMRDSLMRASGLTSYWVTTGPVLRGHDAGRDLEAAQLLLDDADVARRGPGAGHAADEVGRVEQARWQRHAVPDACRASSAVRSSSVATGASATAVAAAAAVAALPAGRRGPDRLAERRGLGSLGCGQVRRLRDDLDGSLAQRPFARRGGGQRPIRATAAAAPSRRTLALATTPASTPATGRGRPHAACAATC